MDVARLRAALRFDGGWWRRLAELGSVYGPEWWKRASPPAIAAIIFVIARSQREAVLRNQRQVSGPRGALRDHWRGYRVFAEFARSMTETMEQWGPHPRPLAITVSQRELALGALAERRGLIVLTGHFGCWEVAARFIADLGRPFNLVTAQEPNPTVREFVHRFRTRHGVRVIYSDRSVFAALPILQALRRGEVVGMQIDPWGPPQGTREIDFCGRPTRFQFGPFAIARVARAPIVPVFALRRGIRRYQVHIAGRFDPTTTAEAGAAFTATLRAYERLVREQPEQWLLFEDIWRGTGEGATDAAYEMVPQASGFRRR